LSGGKKKYEKFIWFGRGPVQSVEKKGEPPLPPRGTWPTCENWCQTDLNYEKLRIELSETTYPVSWVYDEIFLGWDFVKY
jgi:hypothetical protein